MNTARNVKTGSPVPIETDQYEQLIILAQGGALQTATIAGRMFSVANQTAVATSTAFPTTSWAGLGVANPAGSGKNLVFHEFGWGIEVVSSQAGAIGLMTSDTTGFASQIVAIRNCLDGSSIASVAWTEDGATVATPILRRVYGDLGTAATTTVTTRGAHVVDLAGSLVLPPGRSVLTYTTIAATAAFLFHFVWEEVPEIE